MTDFRLRSIACTKCSDQTPLDVAEFLEHSGQFHYNLHLFKCTGCNKMFSTAFYASLHPCAGQKRVYLSADLSANDVMCRLVAMQKGLNDGIRNCFEEAANIFKKGRDPSVQGEKKKNDSSPIEEESPASPPPEVAMNVDDEEEEDPYVDDTEPGPSTSSAFLQPAMQENDDRHVEDQQTEVQQDSSPGASSFAELPKAGAEDKRTGGYSSTEEGEIVTDEDEEDADDWVLQNYGNRGDETTKKRNSIVTDEPPTKKPCLEGVIDMINKKNVRLLRREVENGGMSHDMMQEILRKIKAQKMQKGLDENNAAGEEKKENGPDDAAPLNPPNNDDVLMEDLEEVDEVSGEDDDGTLYVPEGNSQNDDITINLDDGCFPGGSPKSGQNGLLNRTQRRGHPLANRVTFPSKNGGGGAAGGTF